VLAGVLAGNALTVYRRSGISSHKLGK
jgi:hypothetical protein